MEIEEWQLEILKIYKYALIHIGVDFQDQSIQDALEDSPPGMEDAFQATIEYWKVKNEYLEYPNAFLIKALYDHWKANHWNFKWLEDPRFKSPCQKWWEQAEIALGRDLRNRLIADVTEDKKGNEYILFTNGKTLRLSVAQKNGWRKTLEYAQDERGLWNEK